MQRLRYTNPKGQSYEFKLEDPYVLWKIDGIGMFDVETTISQASGQDGYTLWSILGEARTITVLGHVIDSKGSEYQMYKDRHALMNVLNPTSGMGELTYTNDAGQWSIPAFCTGTQYDEKVLYYTTLTISFECPSPFWRDPYYTTVSLSYISGGLRWPVKTPGKFGYVGYRAFVENTGNILTPIEMYIDGGAINPSINNITTGQRIKITRETAEYQQLYINTDPENLTVELITKEGTTETRENAYGYLGLDSDPFLLAPGVNEIQFWSDDQSKAVKIVIKYKVLYAGV